MVAGLVLGLTLAEVSVKVGCPYCHLNIATFRFCDIFEVQSLVALEDGSDLSDVL